MGKYKQQSSDFTEIKQNMFTGWLNLRLTMRKNLFHGRIVVADVFCGDGINIVDSEVVHGSPVSAARAIQRTMPAERSCNP